MLTGSSDDQLCLPQGSGPKLHSSRSGRFGIFAASSIKKGAGTLKPFSEAFPAGSQAQGYWLYRPASTSLAGVHPFRGSRGRTALLLPSASLTARLLEASPIRWLTIVSYKITIVSMSFRCALRALFPTSFVCLPPCMERGPSVGSADSSRPLGRGHLKRPRII